MKTYSASRKLHRNWKSYVPQLVGRTMLSRCAFVGHSLSSRSCFCFSVCLFALRTRKPHRLPPSSRSTGLAKAQSISPDPGVSISATTRDGPTPASTTLRVKAVGKPSFPIARGARRATMPIPDLPGTGCTFASRPHPMSKPASNCSCPAWKTSARSTGTAGWWAATESYLRTRPRRP